MKIHLKNNVSEYTINMIEKPNTVTALLRNIDENIEKTKQNREKKNGNTIKRITGKLKAGKKLTSKELQYLKRFCQELYVEAIKIQRKRNAFEQKIENCQTKEEVMAAMAFEMAHVIEEGENVETLMNAYEDILKEYKKTNKFNALPDREEDEEKKQGTFDYYFYDEESFDCEA